MEQTAFTKKLDDQTVNEADTLKHECRLSKLHQRVLWRKNDKLVVQDGRITVIVDGHKHQLIIRDVTPEDAGYFSCSYGNVSTGCTLRVEELPLAFTETLKDQTVLEAADVTIGCRLSKPYQKVHWLTNSYLVPPYDRITIIAGKFIHRLIIRDVTPEVSGAYRCVCDNVRTQCTLKVVSEGFTKTLKNNTAMETETVTLDCQLSKPYQTVKWTKNEEPVVQDGRITVIVDVHKHQLVIRNVTLEDAGNFSCVCHSAKTECTLQVEGFTKTLKNTTAMEAETVNLDCQLSKPYQTVKWVIKEESVVQDGRISVIVDVHKHQLVIRNVSLEDAGNFSCVYHSARTECTLHVEELRPEFTRTLENQTVYSTITVTQECRLSKPNKTVQWVKNGQQMRFDDRISATVAVYTHRLIIKDVKMEDAGTYRCVYGNVSTQSTLTVEELPEENDWFDGKRYCNWVKTSVSLCYMKKGITEFSNTKAAAFHKDIKERVSLRKAKASSTTCIQCTHKQARKIKGKDKNTTTWRMNCSMNVCNVWLEEILPYHRHVAICPNIEWKNSDPRLWSSDGWEIVKLFQPFGCKDQHKAEDCDATSLLTLLLDCSFFNKPLSNPSLKLLQEIKDVRNVCMHSKDLIMTNGDMEQSLDLMVTFLEETELQKYQTVREAADKIKQLRDSRLDLSLKKSLDKQVLKDKLVEVKHNITKLDDTDNNLRGGTGNMSAQQNTYLGDYRKRLKEFQDLFFEVETTLQNIIQEKENDIEKTSTQFIYLINRLQYIEQDNREVDAFYQPKMSTLDSEHQDVTSESQEQTEQPDTKQLNDAAHSPCFSKELRSQAVFEKATVTLECKLSQPNQTVRWLKGVTQVCSSDHITVEADTYTHRLIIKDVTLEDAGTFWCFCDNIASTCTLEVNELAAEFIKKLENHTALETLTATLVCQLSNPNKAVQWFNDDQQVISDDRITVTADEFTHQLTIRDLKLEDAGNFRCVSGDVSTHCTLTVNELAPEFIGKPDNRSEKETQTVTLNCQLSRPNMNVQWSKAGQQIISDDRIAVTVDIYNHRLVIRDVRMEDAGDYKCVCGNVSTRCTLNVEVVPELPVKFVKPLENTQGYTKSSFSTTLSCELDRPYRNVTWTKGGKVVKSNDGLKIFSGIYTHQLVFSKLTSKVAGQYTCSYGGVSTTAKLTVKNGDNQAARELELKGISAENVRKAMRERSDELQQLTLRGVDLSSLGDQLSDVLTLQHIVKLTLGNITLSHEQCKNLDRDLRGSHQLRELTLRYISCTTHGWKSGCWDLDLGGPLRLHDITLDQLPLTRVVFNPELLLQCDINLPDNVACQVSTLQNLLAARNLQQFTCRYVDHAAAVSKLVDVLPQLHGLQQLELRDIDFGSVTDICLSATMHQLESVYLVECTFDHARLECLLQQHNLPQRRVKIMLDFVTIRGEEDVISKVRQSPDTEVTEDLGVKYSEGAWKVGLFIFYTRK